MYVLFDLKEWLCTRAGIKRWVYDDVGGKIFIYEVCLISYI